MSGISTNGLPLAIAPLTGLEQAAFDTQLPQGETPESEAISIAQIAAYVASANIAQSSDNGTTQALTASMVVPGTGVGIMYHTSAGGSTPTLTTPTAAALLAAATSLGVASGSFKFRLINNNSGTATLAGGTNVTITGTATVATGTAREYLVTEPTAGNLTFTQIS